MVWYKTGTWLVILPSKETGPLSWYCVGYWQVRVSAYSWTQWQMSVIPSSQSFESRRLQVQGQSGWHRETRHPKTTMAATNPLIFFQIICCSNKCSKINICRYVKLHQWCEVHCFCMSDSLCSDVPSFEISCQSILSSPTQLCTSSLEKNPYPPSSQMLITVSSIHMVSGTEISGSVTTNS